MNRFFTLLLAVSCLTAFGQVNCVTTGDCAPYSLSVESYPAVQPGLTTYRFYVNCPSADSKITQITNSSGMPMQFDAPLGVYNSIYGGVTAAGLFANVLGVFPQLTDDSFLTIGLDGPASESAQAGAVNPSFYSSNEPNSTRSFFEVNGGVFGPCIGREWFFGLPH